MNNKPLHKCSYSYRDCTCCVIKPHAVKERSVGAILKDITARGFVLSAVAMFTLERAAAAEFLEVYEGVVPEYSEVSRNNNVHNMI